MRGFALPRRFLSQSRATSWQAGARSLVSDRCSPTLRISAQLSDNADNRPSRAAIGGVTIMHTRTKIALAAILVIGVSSHAMAQSIALNADTSVVAARDAAASASSSRPVASRQSSRSTHMRPRQSRNAGLRDGGYAPWSNPQAPASGPGNLLGSHVGDDNYQYWRQACCQ